VLTPEDLLFKCCTEGCGLIDPIPCEGFLTWNKRHRGDQQISSRLDRFLITDQILNYGGLIIVVVLPSTGSNHCPNLLSWDPAAPKKLCPFRFEKFWLSHPSFMDSVHKYWRSSTATGKSKMAILQQKLKKLRAHIHLWNHTTFGKIFKDKCALELELECIQKNIMDNGHTNTLKIKESTTQKKLNERCTQEETLWRQKSRIQWLKEGERNTAFFHRSTIQHRMTNRINAIKTDEGNHVRTQDEIESELVSHFHSLLSEEHQDRSPAIAQVISHIPPIITPEHNASLLREISMAELEEAFNSMAEGKAPGPDGFTINFFHHCWDLLK